MMAADVPDECWEYDLALIFHVSDSLLRIALMPMTVNNGSVVYHLVAESEHNRHHRIDIEHLVALIINFADEDLSPGLSNLFNSLVFLVYFYLYWLLRAIYV